MAKDFYDRFENEYKDVLSMAKLALNKDEYTTIRDSYRIFDPRKAICNRTHKVISVRAAKLARNVLIHGADIQEAELAFTNLWICLDADKYRLDWRRFQIENGVDKLIDKYKGA